MTTEPCDSWADLLVDYADGELSGSQAAQLEQHLAGCPACRASLARLERSLDLARAVWNESAEVALPSAAQATVRERGRRLAVAACVAAMLLAAGIFWFPRSRVPEVHEVAQQESGVSPAEEIDLQALVAREAQAARLAASANLLAAEAATAPYGQEALAYLASAYPDTEPGRQAARQANHPTEP
jgi:anti-sigma factor RsiW